MNCLNNFKAQLMLEAKIKFFIKNIANNIKYRIKK